MPVRIMPAGLTHHDKLVSPTEAVFGALDDPEGAVATVQEVVPDGPR